MQRSLPAVSTRVLSRMMGAIRHMATDSSNNSSFGGDAGAPVDVPEPPRNMFRATPTVAPIKKVDISHLFDPRADYAYENVKPRFRLACTDDFQIAEGAIEQAELYQAKVHKALLRTYMRTSEDVDHRRYEVPTKYRQRLARSRIRTQKRRELISLMRRAIDANPKYTAVQRRIVERQQAKEIAAAAAKKRV